MNYLAALLVLLLTAPAMAQVVPSPFGGNAGGGGGGTVTSVGTTSPITGGTITTTGTIACPTCTTSAGLTTNVIPVATGASALGDSVFQQFNNTIVPKGITGDGGLGFNGQGYFELLTDGATLSSGLFATVGSVLTLHAANDNPWAIVIFNDLAQPLSSAVALGADGVFPQNEMQWFFGDGAGGGTYNYRLSPQHSVTLSDIFQWGARGSTQIAVGSNTGFAAFDISSSASTITALNNTFLISNLTQNIFIATPTRITLGPDVVETGHYLSSTTTPAVSNTSANSCGTTAATIVGTDVSGRITVGATAGTSCTVTFTTAFANTPICMAANETTGNLMRPTPTLSTLVIAGTMVAADKLVYICLGRV